MADKEIFDFQIGSAPALTDYIPVGQDPSGTPVLRKQTLQTIRNLLFGTPTASGQVPVYNGSTFVPYNIRTYLLLDDFQLSIAGGNLITDAASGYCDSGEMVRTPVNLLMLKVNKFEKGEVGNAELPFAPSAWDHGTVTAKIKHVDVGGNVLNSCDVAWDAQANVTCTADTGVKLEGTGSAKMACTASLAANALIATDVITSVDLTGAKQISFWFRSDVALNAGDVQFLIDNTATCASPTKSWDIPAIAANTWTKVQIPCGDMSGAGNNAIISVGLKQIVDKGAMNLYIDQVCWQGTVTWLFSAVAISSGDTLDVAQGAQVEISGDVKFFEDQVLTFPTLTVGGSPAAGDRLVFAITRKNHASDTHGAGKVCFSGAEIVMTRGA